MEVTDVFATMSDAELSLYTQISTNYKYSTQNEINDFKLSSDYLIFFKENRKIEIKIPNNLYVIDANNKTFDRIIAESIIHLKGKYKPYYRPNKDCGDYVIIVNAQKANFTDIKLNNNIEKLYKSAIRDMLPKTLLGGKLLKKIKVYTNEIKDIETYINAISKYETPNFKQNYRYKKAIR